MGAPRGCVAWNVLAVECRTNRLGVIVYDTPSYHPHRRQFIIAPVFHPIGDDWRAIELSDSHVLSHCPDLRVENLVDGQGTGKYLIGNAFECDKSHPPTAESLVGSSGCEAEALTYSWAGRWALIDPKMVLPDASGLLGLFYTWDSSGRLIITSSLALMQNLIPSCAPYKRKLSWYGMSWFPLPNSRLQGVKKLLPDQVLDLEKQTVRRVRRHSIRPLPSNDADAAARLVLESLICIWEQVSSRFGKVNLALTAGLDTRTLLASAMASGAKFQTVTLMHRNVARADMIVPRELSDMCGVPWSLVQSGRFSCRLRNVYDQHTCLDTNDGDRYWFARDMFKWLDDDDALIRGGTFEIGRTFYCHRFRGLDWERVCNDPSSLVRRFKDFGSTRLETKQFRDWLAWRDMNKEDLGWKDVFYRDQRLAGWLSAIEQSLDLVRGTSIPFANSSYVADLLLSVEEEKRRSGEIQRKVIALAEESLLRVPINAPLGSKTYKKAQQLREKVYKAAVELRNLLIS